MPAIHPPILTGCSIKIHLALFPRPINGISSRLGGSLSHRLLVLVAALGNIQGEAEQLNRIILTLLCDELKF
jgi:hypothetical protein